LPLAPYTDETQPSDKAAFGGRLRVDKEVERNRDRSGLLGSRRGQREDGEGWQNVKPRKSFGHEDSERWQRNGDHDRERRHKEGDGEPPRRNGLGRGGKFDQPWGREESAAPDTENTNANRRNGGWRDRERKDEREWTRGGRLPDKLEELPEWMDTPTIKNESKAANTQEEFQKWKEAMKAGNKSTAVSEEKKTEPAPEEPPKVKQIAAAGKSVKTPLTFEGDGFKNLIQWDDKKITALPTPGKTPGGKSKFAGLFGNKAQNPAAEEPNPMPASPGAMPPDADKEGFQRILQMLGKPGTLELDQQKHARGGALFGLQSPPPPSSFFDQPQGPTSPTREDAAPRRLPSFFGGDSKPWSPDPAHMAQLPNYANGQQDDQPLRNGQASTPVTFQNIFSPPPSTQPQAPSRDKQFLLNLMQQSRTPTQQKHHTPRPPSQDNFNIFLEDQQHPVTQQSQSQKPNLRAGPPPGLPDSFNTYSNPSQIREPARKQPSRHEQQQGPPPPSSFFDNPSISLAGQQGDLPRRSTNESVSARRNSVFDSIAPKQHHREPTFSEHDFAVHREREREQLMKQRNHAQDTRDHPLLMHGDGPPGMNRNMPRGAPPPGFRVPPGFPQAAPPQPQAPGLPHPNLAVPQGHPSQQGQPRGGMPQGMFNMPPPGYFGGPPGPGPGPLPPPGFMELMMAQGRHQGQGRGGPGGFGM